ncbi:phosphoenolpyruvate carboxylase [Tessaracoccus sp. Z1128]
MTTPLTAAEAIHCDSDSDGLERLLEADIDLLAELHDQVLRESGAGELATLMRRLQDLAARAADGGDADQPGRIVEAISAAQALQLAHALTVHFHLINLAEERYRSRLIRGTQSDLAGTAPDVWPAVAALGPAAARVEGLRIHPVLTAHPTEARRRAVSSALNRIAEQLDEYDDRGAGSQMKAFARRRMLEEIDILGRTSPLRATPPHPSDEVRTIMSVFDQTLFRAVPRLYRTVEAAIANGDSGHRRPVVPAFLRFGSWVGGDRDGNPFVTAEVTRQTMTIQAEHILKALAAGTERVARTLTMSEEASPPSPELANALARDAVTAPEIFNAISKSSPGEPHRQKLLFVANRLTATRQGHIDLAYRDPGELVADLTLIQTSLERAGDARAAFGELQHVVWLAQTFGFHLADLEVRQHSAVHRAALDELLGQLDWDPQAQGSPTRLQLLDSLTVNGWPAHVQAVTDSTREVLDTMRVMAWLQGRWGVQSCGRHVVSFTQTSEHLVAVRALARLAVGDSPIRLDVVPLFETGEDLRGAVDVLEEWLTLESTCRWLEDVDRHVEVMVGYSDSAKDVGPASATLTLYQTQTELVEWANRHGIELTLFHGRGGSLGRGGGPVHRAILAQPPGSVSGRFKVTEQGEVIFARYADVTLAQAHLERLTSAVLLADTDDVVHRNRTAAEEFSDVASTVERVSRETYLNLVGQPGFADVVAESSPLEELGQLRLGSRPARRSGAEKGRDLSDFRAIPWVFAWSQIRANVPGWFGLGSGLAAVGDMERLRAAYSQWPLFASMIDIAEMSLAKANPRLAESFLALGGQPLITRAVLAELKLTRRFVLGILDQQELLECKPRLRTRVALRAPSIDALSHLQLRALRIIRDCPSVNARADQDRDLWTRVLLTTVNGAAAGLQNTG